MTINELASKNIIILGLGREGLSTYTLLRTTFKDKPLTLADKKPLEALTGPLQETIKRDSNVTLLLGNEDYSFLGNYDVVIKSAGIPLKSIKHLTGQAIITTQTALFMDICEGTIIGVTGTKGKSTTTTVIYEVLKRGGKDVVLCGNIGLPAFDFIPTITKDTLVVMEISSHQLQLVTKSPHIAVLQNIVPEHLDFYEGFDDYAAAKANITKYQKEHDYFLYNAAYEIPTAIAQTTKAQTIPYNTTHGQCFVKERVVYYRKTDDEPIVATQQLRLIGEHNVQNIMPAIIVGKLYGIPSQVIAEAILQFKGLEDRMEFVGTVAGVDYINDSLSTIPEAAIAAIDALGDRVATIMLGGFDRGLDFSELGKKVANSPSIQTVVLFPTTGEKIWQAIQEELRIKNQESRVKHFFVDSMAEAVKIAKEQTSAGKVCLMSPASPSFGIFKDYHDRGKQFKSNVLGL